MVRIDDKTREQIVSLYNAGSSIAEIISASGINSTGTIYRILNEAGAVRPRKQRAATFQVLVTLPSDLREFVDGIGDFSDWVTKLVYSQIEGRSAKTKLPYSETEGDLPYSGFEGGSGGGEFRDGLLDSSAEEENPDIAKLTVIFYKDCAEIKRTEFRSYVDESLLQGMILWYSRNEGLQDVDEIAVYDKDQQLLWLWKPIYNNGYMDSLEL